MFTTHYITDAADLATRPNRSPHGLEPDSTRAGDRKARLLATLRGRLSGHRRQG